jgi:hypothetical protein
MKAMLPSLTVVLALSTLVSGQQIVRAAAVGAYVGRAVTVEDTVAQVSHEPRSGFTYLNFGGQFPKHLFRAVVPDALRARLAASVLTASRVRVTGMPRLDVRGIPEIVCLEPTQLAAVGGIVSPAAAGVATVPPATAPGRAPAAAARPCCRICTTGKACGNSCIARTSTCRQPAGCACNG